ncbi:Transcription Elongation Factor Spt5 [Manis pentadactyla]|nr:Transcription Elongation Factor Spt5 [Manis pentadactyla]
MLRRLGLRPDPKDPGLHTLPNSPRAPGSSPPGAEERGPSSSVNPCGLGCYRPRPSLLDAALPPAPRVRPHPAPRHPGSPSLEALSSRARGTSWRFLPRTAPHKQPGPSGAPHAARGECTCPHPIPSSLRTNGSASHKLCHVAERIP